MRRSITMGVDCVSTIRDDRVMDALTRAIESAGGVGKLASAIGLKQNVVGNWRLRGQVPAQHCIAIETATTGAVTRHDLRPDVFGAPAANDDSATRKGKRKRAA